jgi:hypothetical protein
VKIYHSWLEFESDTIQPSNRYIIALLVIYQVLLDWLLRDGFSYKGIKEHKQESVKLQFEFANMNEAEINMMFKFLSQKD